MTKSNSKGTIENMVSYTTLKLIRKKHENTGEVCLIFNLMIAISCRLSLMKHVLYDEETYWMLSKDENNSWITLAEHALHVNEDFLETSYQQACKNDILTTSDHYSPSPVKHGFWRNFLFSGVWVCVLFNTFKI